MGEMVVLSGSWRAHPPWRPPNGWETEPRTELSFCTPGRTQSAPSAACLPTYRLLAGGSLQLSGPPTSCLLTCDSNPKCISKHISPNNVKTWQDLRAAGCMCFLFIYMK